MWLMPRCLWFPRHRLSTQPWVSASRGLGGMQTAEREHKESADWRLSIFTTHLTPGSHLASRREGIQNTFASQKNSPEILTSIVKKSVLSPLEFLTILQFFFRILNSSLKVSGSSNKYLEIKTLKPSYLVESDPVFYQDYDNKILIRVYITGPLCLSLSFFGDISSEHLIWFWWIQM